MKHGRILNEGEILNPDRVYFFYFFLLNANKNSILYNLWYLEYFRTQDTGARNNYIYEKP